MIAIIDYGVGNLFSLKCSFNAIGVETEVTSDPKTIEKARAVVLPGVGAFRDAAKKLTQSGLSESVYKCVEAQKPLLGICLGMQLLFEKSREYGEYPGLGILKGEVCPIENSIPKELKIPHMGWNSLDFTKESPLFKYIKNGDFVYFVHSYSAINCDDSLIATADYGTPLTAAVGKDNVFGCQFHPEKSGKTGLNILKAFCETGGVEL